MSQALKSDHVTIMLCSLLARMRESRCFPLVGLSCQVTFTLNKQAEFILTAVRDQLNCLFISQLQGLAKAPAAESRPSHRGRRGLGSIPLWRVYVTSTSAPAYLLFF